LSDLKQDFIGVWVELGAAQTFGLQMFAAMIKA